MARMIFGLALVAAVLVSSSDAHTCLGTILACNLLETIGGKCPNQEKPPRNPCAAATTTACASPPVSNSQMEVLNEQPFVFFGQNMVATTIRLTFPPGDVGDDPHTHPGAVTGYVEEGEFLLQVNNGPHRILRTGQAFFEKDGDVHMWGANGSNTQTTKVIATLWLRAGEDMLTFVNRPRECRDEALKLAAQGK